MMFVKNSLRGPILSDFFRLDMTMLSYCVYPAKFMSGNTPSINVKEAFSSAIKEKYLLLHLCNLSFSKIQPAFGLYIMHGFNAHLQRLSNCNSQIK